MGDLTKEVFDTGIARLFERLDSIDKRIEMLEDDMKGIQQANYALAERIVRLEINTENLDAGLLPSGNYLSVDILTLIASSLEFARGNKPTGSSLEYEEVDSRMIVFFPKAERVDYQELLRRNNEQLEALRSL